MELIQEAKKREKLTPPATKTYQEGLHALHLLLPCWDPSKPAPNTHHLSFPLGRVQTQAACTPLRCVSPGQPLSASEHLFLEAFDNRPRV